MSYTYSFEKLEVWKESKELCVLIYKLTEGFPENEKFGLVSQLRRATISISSNIAEGSGRNSNKDKAHFTNIAFSSAIEILNQLIISQELNFIKTEEYNLVRSKIESITNKLNSLRNFQYSKQ